MYQLLTRAARRLTLLTLPALLLAGCSKEPPPVEPASPDTLTGKVTALRSVLDGRARILTLHMADDLRMAYDTGSGNLYELWRGAIDLKGPVFDNRHGPQPTSEGARYLSQPDASWHASEGEWVYAGHRFAGQQPVLRYELRGEGWTALIEETPFVQRAGDQVTLERRFAVYSLPGDVELILSGQDWPEQVALRGAGEQSEKGGLTLAEGDTTLTLTYTKATPIETDEAVDPEQHPGKALIANSDCSACHNPETKTVGPSYQSMAERYDATPENRAMLAEKIIRGGAGNWGQVPMSPHPDLNQEDAEQMVEYIFSLRPETDSDTDAVDRPDLVPEITDPLRVKTIPGDQRKVAGMHPAFDRFQARPDDFEPMVGGIDFLPGGRMVITTWDPEGSVYIVSDYDQGPAQASVKRIARGLAEPLGVKVVDGDIYVLQKQELTRLVDVNDDEVIDIYETVAADWSVTDNFHEFAFGLEYEDGHFYGALATAILSGGASADPQAPDRGKAIKIRKTDGQVEFIAHGLRTPNGIGFGVDGELFIADNQGDWLPSSKIVELTPGAWYGSRSVDFEGTADLTETKPVVWLPQDEIGNSPSEPAPLNVGPYQNQMIHGEVTHGGIKRVYAERVNGRLQGAVFRFIQGLEAGVNRLDWAPDGSLIVGGIGNPGNWADGEKQWYGLERLVYNGETAFEMLSVSARTDGFVIEFTEPMKAGQNIGPEDFEILRWYYEPTAEYGGPKKNVTELPVEGFALSEDRKRVSFKLGGLKPDHVVYFRIARPFVSETDNSLWTTEAWYTLNAIPEDQPVEIEGRQPEHNQLTDTEQAEGWKLLFDGESLEGLRNYNADTLGKRWTVDNGTLHFQGKAAAEGDGWKSEEGGDLVLTDQPVTDFEFYMEWKLSRNGNSGLLYSIDEGHEASYMTGPEYQLLDNVGHPDGEIYTHRAGDLYDLIAASPVTVNPVGEWNRTRLVVNNGQVEHWLNGYKVVETEWGSPEWKTMIAKSKFADWEAFAATPEGHIVLQDHGDAVWFRNIKLRELD